MQILVDEAHIRIISKDRKSAQRKMMRGLHSRLRKWYWWQNQRKT